jgi:LysM repeat protein
MRFSGRNYHLWVILGSVVFGLGLLVWSAAAQGTSTSTTEPSATATPAERPSTYTIQRGDTLDTIGQALNVSVEALTQANQIKRTTILKIGDTLIIPPDAPPYGVFPALTNPAQTDTTSGQGGGIAGETYVMQPGDVLDVIAQKKNVSVDSLKIANNVKNVRKLMPGTVIIIPSDAPPYGVFPATDNPSSTDTTSGQGGGASGPTYVVQPNDTLDHIAAQHNVQTACLAKSNNLKTPSKIFPGKTLVIDTSCPAYDGYDVVPTQQPPAAEGSG